MRHNDTDPPIKKPPSPEAPVVSFRVADSLFETRPLEDGLCYVVSGRLV